MKTQESYKDLRINEVGRIKHASMKKKIRNGNYRNIQLILKLVINSKYRIKTINDWRCWYSNIILILIVIVQSSNISKGNKKKY